MTKPAPEELPEPGVIEEEDPAAHPAVASRETEDESAYEAIASTCTIWRIMSAKRAAWWLGGPQ